MSPEVALEPSGFLAIFGGSFDPPHVAHVLAAAYVLSSTRADGVLVVPTFQHPFDKRMGASFDHRFAMCRLAFLDLARVELSNVERELGGPSRTIRTLEELRTRRPDQALRLVLGADLLAEMQRWHRFDDLERIAPPVVLGRSGYPNVGTVTLPEVSSTEMRRRLRARESTDGLLPVAVADYIAAHGLYASEAES